MPNVGGKRQWGGRDGKGEGEMEKGRERWKMVLARNEPWE
jgi:hypothetical protein